MLCSSSSSKCLLLPLTYSLVASPAKVRASVIVSEGDRSAAAPTSGVDELEGAQTKRASTRLRRWSRARMLHSGRKLDRIAEGDKLESFGSPAPSPITSGSSLPLAAAAAAADEADDDDAKKIFMVSDSTGWTAEHTLNAALGQFEQCVVDQDCPVSTHLFSGIDDEDRLMEIIKQAAKEEALLLFTLADPSMAEAAKKACKLWGVPFSDLLGPITEAIAAHLGAAPVGIPRGAPGGKVRLSEEYFRRIEAIDFTIKQDDGALPRNLALADIVLVGVSRTGKTPLSTYLALKGYKVANVPLVMGAQLPDTLFEVDQDKVIALTIDPVALQTIRRTRAKSLGFNREMERNYSHTEHVKRELELASQIYAQNPSWPVVEVTTKSVEETAAIILRILHERKDKADKHAMPCISKWY